jgi:plastocyanin
MINGRSKISVSGLAVMFLASWAFGSAARTDQESGTVIGEVLINAAPAAGAVVYLQPQGSRPSEPAPREVTIIQEQLRFKPSFSVVPAGTTVRFENHDDEIHNIYSKSGANRFDTGAHLPGTVKKVTLKERGAVPLRCRTHQNMRGLIFVSPSPYYSVTDDRGQFEIRNIPSGSYRIEAWHPRLTAEESARGGQTLDVKAGPKVLLLRFDAKAPSGADLTETAQQDWTSIVEQIRAELERAIASWKKANRTAATSTVMSAQSKLYGESGLRERIAQTIGPDRALEHERRFDSIRKQIQGIGGTEPVTEAALRQEANRLIDGLTADVKKMTAP